MLAHPIPYIYSAGSLTPDDTDCADLSRLRCLCTRLRGDSGLCKVCPDRHDIRCGVHCHLWLDLHCQHDLLNTGTGLSHASPLPEWLACICACLWMSPSACKGLCLTISLELEHCASACQNLGQTLRQLIFSQLLDLEKHRTCSAVPQLLPCIAKSGRCSVQGISATGYASMHARCLLVEHCCLKPYNVA